MAGDQLKIKRSYKEISFKVPWGTIAAKEWGPDDGKPFLGLHDWLDNANTFDRLAPLLPADIKLIAIDFPGHGRSSHRWPGMSYICFEFVADVKRVVSQIGWERFSIIGHSLGADIGALYAGTFPHEVETLIQLDIGGIMILLEDNPAFVLVNYATTLLDLKQTTPQVHENLESGATRRQKNVMGTSLRTCKEDAVLLVERGTRFTKNGLIFSHDPRLKGKVCPIVPFIEPQSFMMSILSNTRCEVLVLESTDHWHINIDDQQREYQLERSRMICQNARCKVWNKIKGGHHFHMEKPEQVAGEIKQFLTLCRSLDQSPPSKL